MFSSTPLFPTPPLVWPNFFHVPLGIGGSPFRYKERRCWAKCLCNYFLRFPTYVITVHQRHRQTDDIMRSQDRALYKSALRGKNTVKDQKLIHRVATSQRSQGLLGAIPPFPQSTTLKNFKRINTEMYEKNNVIFAQFPLVIFGAFFVIFFAQFSGGSNYRPSYQNAGTIASKFQFQVYCRFG